MLILDIIPVDLLEREEDSHVILGEQLCYRGCPIRKVVLFWKVKMGENGWPEIFPGKLEDLG